MKIKIDKNNEDAFARYQMPALEVIYEGKASNSKTVLKNIECVTKSLNRDVLTLIKYIEYEKGIKIDNKNDKFSMKGTHRIDELQEIIYKFIESFVLCKVCRNPETLYKLEHLDEIQMECLACGEKSDIEKHKIYKHILNDLKKFGDHSDKKYERNEGFESNDLSKMVLNINKNTSDASFADIIKIYQDSEFSQKEIIKDLIGFIDKNKYTLLILKHFKTLEACELLGVLELKINESRLNEEIIDYLNILIQNEILDKDECREYFKNKSKVLKRDESNLIRFFKE
ncbi:eukaryotic translation initiation factor 5 [Conglomerata obtusa]